MKFSKDVLALNPHLAGEAKHAAVGSQEAPGAAKRKRAKKDTSPAAARLAALVATAPSGHWPASEERAALALSARGWIWMWNGARYAGLRAGVVCGAAESLVELEGVLE